METIDGGDIGENELYDILREGLAAACLPQQLLEEHLHRKPGPAHTLLKEEATTRQPGSPRRTAQPQQSQACVLATPLREMAREDWIQATLQMDRQARTP